MHRQIGAGEDPGGEDLGAEAPLFIFRLYLIYIIIIIIGGTGKEAKPVKT